MRICVALGWCYKRTGRLDLAIEALEKALILEPSEAMLRYNLACYLSLAGHKGRALRHLSQALSLEPAYCQMVDEEPDFDSIRADPEFQAVCEAARQQGCGGSGQRRDWGLGIRDWRVELTAG